MEKLKSNTLTKFIIVGVINTVVGMSIMFGLYNIAGCSYWISTAANYILVSFLSYYLNKRFTFQHEGEVVKSGIRFALNITICYFLAYGIAKPWVMWVLEGQSRMIQENAAILVGMLLFTGFNYGGQRWFVFREKHVNPKWKDFSETEKSHQDQKEKGPLGDSDNLSDEKQ